ncbi:LLM class flavin-dependent oxidoreductase, partial [Teratosphaeria destructans]
AREGDFLGKEDRYARLEEYIRILRRAWASAEPFDWDGRFYQFRDFSSRVQPVDGRIPISVGGSSPEAYRVGGALADIFGLWGEPLRETKEQIEAIYAEAAKAGRRDRPRIWTEELAWAKAQRTLEALRTHRGQGLFAKNPPGDREPQNAGSRRLLEIARRGEVHDRGLWYPTVTATNARGASTALVGTPQIVADTILDYVDLGCELISIRGYDHFHDAVQYGREILPLVRRQLEEGRGKEERVVPEVVQRQERHDGVVRDGS